MNTRIVTPLALSTALAVALVMHGAEARPRPPQLASGGAVPACACPTRGVAEFAGPSRSKWTAPPGVHSVVIELWGGSGGGSKGFSHNNSGNGGGAGAYARSGVPVVPGETYLVTVGAGGAGASSTDPWGTPGEDGGASEFRNAAGAVLLFAGGGAGGAGVGDGAGGQPDDLAQIGRPGGDGSDGYLLSPGAGGAATVGSLEAPYPLGGGRGAGGELTSAAQPGGAGYLLLSW